MMLRNSHWNKSKIIRLNDFILGKGKMPKKGRLVGMVAGWISMEKMGLNSTLFKRKEPLEIHVKLGRGSCLLALHKKQSARWNKSAQWKLSYGWGNTGGWSGKRR